MGWSVSHLAIGLGLLLALWLGLWLAAVLLIRVLPEGAARSAISLLPSTLTLFQRLIRSRAVPRRARDSAAGIPLCRVTRHHHS